MSEGRKEAAKDYVEEEGATSLQVVKSIPSCCPWLFLAYLLEDFKVYERCIISRGAYDSYSISYDEFILPSYTFRSTESTCLLKVYLAQGKFCMVWDLHVIFNILLIVLLSYLYALYTCFLSEISRWFNHIYVSLTSWFKTW